MPLTVSSARGIRALTLLVPLFLAGQAAAQGTRDLEDAVLRTHPSTRAASLAVEAAEARARVTGFAGPWVLSAEAEEIPDGVRLDRGSARVEVEREFVGRGRRDAARALAQTEVTAAAIRLDATRQRLAAETRLAVAQASGFGRIAQRLAGEDSLLASAESALRARFSVGEARYVDVLRLRTERLRVQAERSEALSHARAGRIALRALLVGSPSADSSLDEAISAAAARLGEVSLPAAPPLDTLLARATLIAQADAAIERARADRTLLLAESRPRWSGGLGLQRFGAEDGGPGTVGLTISGSVTLPSTARGATRLGIEAADREIAAAVAGRDAIRAALQADLAAAFERYEAARIRVAAFDQALLRGAREEREAALASFRTGELTLLELLDFERSLTQAETARVRGLIDAADALADLFTATAGESPFLLDRNSHGEP